MADRISSLPDTVLCHILSFLPTKLAVATSVLSKRWYPLWSSVPTLDLDDQSNVKNEETRLRFLLFVSTVILSRKMAQPIQMFRLKCGRSPLCAASDVNRWVNAAVERRVEHLDLDIYQRINLPVSILTCRTLVVLKLNGLTVNAVPSVDFSSLKILHLKRVQFTERHYLIKLLSGCPILEDLQMKSLKFDDFRHGKGFRSLSKLVKADISSTYIPYKVMCNVEFLRTHLIYRASHYPVFHNLTHLELIMILPYKWGWVAEMLTYCTKLQILVIDKRQPNETDSKNWAYPKFLPKCFTSHLRTCSLSNYGGLKAELQFARYVMQNARVLRTMTICSTSSSDPQAKLEMLKKLSMIPRSSTTCEISFE